MKTPFLQLDLKKVCESFCYLRLQFPQAAIYYAVKANPAPEIISFLNDAGSRFDVASPAEIDLCRHAGVSAARISYGNTIKKAEDIAYAFERGIRLFAFDSGEELDKLATFAPGASVFCRLLVESDGARWPLSRKFGCASEMAVRLLQSCPHKGLVPYGISFHVGSQQTDPTKWENPIRLAAGLFDRLRMSGVELKMVNLGGGFPASYREPIPALSEYAQCIRGAIHRHFGSTPPRIMIEPGRSLVADAGKVVTEVVLISRKNYGDDVRWVFLDIGKFGGLAETLEESIQYRLRTPHDGGPSGRVILAGPTCDSTDILYEKADYELPMALRIGDRIEILSAGAYTSSYASVGFNGFAPLATCFVESRGAQ
jgi:ornithine decarboxylase